MLNVSFLFYCIIGVCAVFCLNTAVRAHKRERVELNFIRREDYRETKAFFVVLSFLVLFLPAALREGIGRDYDTYAQAYINIVNNNIPEITVEWLGEPFIVVCKIVAIFFGENYYLFFGLISFCTLFLFYKAIWKQSNMPAVSLFIYMASCLYFQTYNQARQGLAFAICAYALYFLRKKKNFKFLIAVLIATLIHKSAAVLFPLIFVYNKPFNHRTIFLYSGLTVFVIIGFPIILKIISQTSYGKIYLDWEEYDTSFELTAILNLIIRIAFSVISFFCYKDLMKTDKSLVVYFHMSIVCTILQIATLQNQLFARVTTYYFLGYIFLFPQILCSLKKRFKEKDFITVIFFVCFIIYFLIYYFSSQGAIGSGYEIYKSIFN